MENNITLIESIYPLKNGAYNGIYAELFEELFNESVDFIKSKYEVVELIGTACNTNGWEYDVLIVFKTDNSIYKFQDHMDSDYYPTKFTDDDFEKMEYDVKKANLNDIFNICIAFWL
jgi:hypothetical protein